MPIVCRWGILPILLASTGFLLVAGGGAGPCHLCGQRRGWAPQWAPARAAAGRLSPEQLPARGPWTAPRESLPSQSSRDLQAEPRGLTLGMTLTLSGVTGLGSGVSFRDARGGSPVQRWLGACLWSGRFVCSRHGSRVPGHRHVCWVRPQTAPRAHRCSCHVPDVCGWRSRLESVSLAGAALSGLT